MASVSPLASVASGAAGISGIAGRPRQQSRPGGGAIDTAAKALGLGRDDVIAALRAGSSMDDLAERQGVSHDDLVSALKKDMPAELANSGRADEIAARIAAQKGLPGNRTRHPDAVPTRPHNPSQDTGTGVLGGSLTSTQQSTLTKLSALLGTDSGTLLKQLRDGTSLSTLTAAAAVSSASLASILQDGLMVDRHV